VLLLSKLPELRRAGRRRAALAVALAVLCLGGCTAEGPSDVDSPGPSGTPAPITEAEAVRIATERWSRTYPVVRRVEATLDRDEWVVKGESRDPERGEIVLVMRLDLYGNWINDGSHEKGQD
jgi:hypothetical protein